MKSIFIRVIRRLVKDYKTRNFKSFDKTSGFESSTKFNGTERIIIGSNSYFGPNCEITALGNHFGQKLSSQLIVGNHVRLTSNVRITAASNIIIDDDVLLAPYVFITDHNHGMNPNFEGGYSPQPLLLGDVHIKCGVWIGQYSCVLPGVTIGAHSIIGAGSIVTHDIPEYSIAVGSPAKVIKRWSPSDNEWIVV